MSYNDMPFTDGFNGKTLSIFDDTQFKDNKIVKYLSFPSSVSKFAFDSSKLSIFSLICAFKSSILGNPKGIVAPEPQTIISVEIWLKRFLYLFRHLKPKNK
jgi:hypothetical protein